MKLAEIKENYKVESKERGKFLNLFDKNCMGIYNVDKYLVTLERVNTGIYKILGSRYSNSIELNEIGDFKEFDILQLYINSYVDGYDFNSEFYNPDFTDGYMETIAVHDYLINTLGFEFKDDSFGLKYYTKKLPGAYYENQLKIGISINGLSSYNETYSKDIEISMHFNTSIISSKIEFNALKICYAIDSLIKPVFLINAAESIKFSKILRNSNTQILQKKITGLNINITDITENLILQLEQTLEILKK
jgi:hypothetical protein